MVAPNEDGQLGTLAELSRSLGKALKCFAVLELCRINISCINQIYTLQLVSLCFNSISMRYSPMIN